MLGATMGMLTGAGQANSIDAMAFSQQLAAQRNAAAPMSTQTTVLEEVVGRLNALLGQYGNNCSRIRGVVERTFGAEPSQQGRDASVSPPANGILTTLHQSLEGLGEVCAEQSRLLERLEKIA